MTQKQKENFNKMRRMLERISKHYMTPAQVEKNAEKSYGLNYLEALEMSYENMQSEAKSAVKGIRLLK